jgi:protein-S-isoprenylcysteine O-methyltransferase Ste14
MDAGMNDAQPTPDDVRSRRIGWIWALAQFLLLILWVLLFRHNLGTIDFDPLHPHHLLGIAFMAIGFIVLIMAAATLRSGLTPNPVPRPGAMLVTGGLYGRMRHPIYFAMILLLVGGTMLAYSMSLLLGTILLLLFYLSKARFEEKVLAQHYPDYDAYRQRTGAFTPKVRRR